MLPGLVVLIAGTMLTPRLMASRSLGVDVSSYQGSGVNWTSVKGSGITFAWAKATEGTGTTDADFTLNASHGKSAGVYMGAYHFAHPASASPASEENYFWSVAGGYIAADGKTLMPMLDMEVFTGVNGASSYSDWANQWCDDAVADATAKGVHIKPAIYTSACSACNFNSSIAQWSSDIADYNGQSAQTGTPWSTCGSCAVWGAGVWNFWQYTDSGAVSGISGGVDSDVFNGTAAQVASTMVATSTTVTGGGPDACSRGAGMLDVFTRGVDKHLWKKSYSGGAWSAWQDLGENLSADPSAVAKDATSVDVFWNGSGALWHKTWTAAGGWTVSASLGGSILGGPDACSRNSGVVDVFARGSNNDLQKNTWTSTAGWSGWSSLGETVTSDPTACCRDANTVDVFWNGNGALWHKSWTAAGGWSASASLGGAITWGPDACSKDSSTVDVFVRGTDQALYKNTWSAPSGWSGFQNLGGVLASSPSTVAWDSTRVDTFTRGTDNNIYQKYWTSASGWSGFISLGHE